jgi:ribonuclease P protein subunit POP4
MSSITPRNILRHELIGLNVRIMGTKTPTVRGIRGVVVDETRNMLMINARRKKVMVPKNIATFRFELPGHVIVDVDGKRLVAKPENRLKTRVRRW